MTDVFGPIISRWQVEQAVLNVLQNPPASGLTSPRLVYYLAEIERQNSLGAQTLPVPPGPNSYRGGVDTVTLQAEWFPMLTVVAQPAGKPVAVDTFTYAQSYEISVTATVGDDNEDTARMIADHYGAAVVAAILQNGSLGIGATTTMLARMPSAELLSAVTRQVLRSVAVFTTTIAPAVTNAGPTSWQSNPYSDPSSLPAVDTVNVTVAANSL